MKKIKTLILTLLLIGGLCLNVKTASAIGASASKTTLQVGQTATITVNSSDAAGRYNYSASGGVSINKSSDWLEGSRSTITVTAKSAGTASVTINGTGLTSLGANPKPKSFSKTITFKVVPKSSGGSSGGNSGGSSNNSSNNNTNNNNDTKPTENLSKDNNLASLTVSEGTLSPKFSADTTKYSMTLSSNVKEITVSAKAKDAKAKVSGTGKKSLSFGKNEIYVVCTAENGSKKTYSILVTVDETPDTFMNFGDAKLGIVKNLSDIDLPHKSFEESKVTYDGAEVTAWTSNQMEKTIVYLMNDDGEKNFYLFDDGKITSKFVPVTLAGIPMFVVDIAKDSQTIPEMQYQALEIDKKEVMGWVYDDKKLENYELLSLMQENGKMQYYLHEKTNDTYMLSSNDFFNQAIELSEMKDANDSLTLTRNIFIGTTVVAVAGCAVLGYLYFSFKKKSISAIKDYYSKKTQD